MTSALAGCSSGSVSEESSDSTQTTEGFPVTFEHMYGQTTLGSTPERVATWGFGSTEAALALGVVPTAMAEMPYGGGDERILPWVSDAIAELGGDAPTLLDNTNYELSVEQLLATDPDVLLAPHSGLTEQEYKAVTDAGVPVVAPPEAVWSTPWRDAVTLTGRALGLEDQAKELVTDLDRQVSEAGAAHPEFADASVAYISELGGTYYLLLPSDPRVELLEDLGLTSSQSVLDLAYGESTFSTTVSAENLDRIDADIIVTQVDTPDALQSFVGSDTSKLLPAVAKGAVAGFVGQEAGAAIGPTALSLPYFLPTLTEELARATAVAQS